MASWFTYRAQKMGIIEKVLLDFYDDATSKAGDFVEFDSTGTIGYIVSVKDLSDNHIMVGKNLNLKIVYALHDIHLGQIDPRNCVKVDNCDNEDKRIKSRRVCSSKERR